MNSMRELLIHELKDLYSAEKQLVEALPKMAKGAKSPKLQEAFRSHLEETEGHLERVAECLSQLKENPGNKKCVAMEGLVEEGSEILKEKMDGALKDAALIGAAQRVEHYEMAAYGTARAFAETIGEEQIARTLDRTLEEESSANEKLTQIARDVNQQAKSD